MYMVMDEEVNKETVVTLSPPDGFMEYKTENSDNEYDKVTIKTEPNNDDSADGGVIATQEEGSNVDKYENDSRNIDNYNTLLKTSVDNKIVTCDVCKKSMYKRNLTRHARTHGKHFQCSLCPSKFSEKWSLEDHEARHVDPLICETCGKTFGSRVGLHRHMKSHSAGQQIECDICNQMFSTREHYEGHRNSKHLNNRPFKCNNCDKDFAYGQSLNRHVKLCKGQKKLNCKQCDAIFNSNVDLRQHQLGKHGSAKYTCICGKSYSWIRSFQRHKKTCTKLLDNFL